MASMNGTIKRLVSDKGFGFILADDGNEYFFHNSACTGTRFDDLTRYQISQVERQGRVIGYWIVIGAGVALAALVFGRTRRRNDGDANLGSVSSHWVAEHRLGSGGDSQR